MMHQDSYARAHAVAVQFVSRNQVNRLHVPHCTFTRWPAPAHLEGETAQVAMEFLGIGK